MKLSIALIAVCLALVVSGCGGSDDATSADSGNSPFARIVEDGGKAKPRIYPPDLPPPKEVLVRDLKEGKGAIADRGEWVYVRYVGVKYETGVEGYRRWHPESPLRVRLGFGDDGKGWEEGIEGMREGGRREIIVPSHLLYDNGTFDYVVELVRVEAQNPIAVSAEQEGPFAAISGGKGKEMPEFVPSGQPVPKKVVVRDIVEGSGPPARIGDEVGIYYAGAVYQTGKIKYYGWTPGVPATFDLGKSVFGRAWEKSMVGMRAGGVREIIITAEILNDTDTLDYVIEMVNVGQASDRE